ncbi:LysM peptidoglycan-binding and 3D domain-containing protein [Bacillus sp. REN16]|uniref:LysM peptidoglycan-binding and 3D domain-containing protein n=1 Tax=Bacillus sp. REN16 TaxID=2887296 RepID=UPI001E57BE14|nr:3D domain-containing protein [Bacillus sp. REN16]MCC3359024.1 LysM peptidoglycan-binding domain-containing protein [Bacillus sp. REN16]
MLKRIVTILAGTVLSVSVSANVQASTITVQKGDTLWDLSQANNTSVKNIKMVNQLTTDLIHPGDDLIVVPEKQYTVTQGDTLWDIAEDHQVTVSQLQEWNQIHKNPDLIHPGLNLVIFEGVKATTTANAETQAQTVVKVPKETASAAPAVETQEETEVAAPITETQKEIEAAAPVTETSNTSQAAVPPAQTQEESTSASSTSNKKELVVEATAYTATCEGCSGITSTGINLLENQDAKVISVDPSVIPLGSKVYVEGYGEAIAGDTGGAIKGNKIDVFIPSKQEAINFGRKQLKVTILD